MMAINLMRKLATARYILSIIFIIAIHQLLPPVSAFSSLPSLTARDTYYITKLDAVSNRDREEELAKLATNLKVSPAKVTELLKGQRRKLSGSEPKAIHIDWLLNVTPDDKTINRKIVPKKAVSKKKTAVPKKKTTNKMISKDKTLLSNIEFAQRTDLHPATKRALVETLGLVSMTEIQSKTFDAALSGKDVLGRARTGTGKTIAFLLPAIERVLRSPEYNSEEHVGVLVISPTRELASQIGDEAEKLLTFHKDMLTQVVFGGTKTTRDVSRLKKNLPTVLVATPGRLKDLLQTANINGRKFSKIMQNTPVVVLDEVS